MAKPKKKDYGAVVRADGELYQRPTPNPFGNNWKDGFHAGYDGEPVKPMSDKEWRDGYQTGAAQRIYDREEMDRAGSSNA